MTINYLYMITNSQQVMTITILKEKMINEFLKKNEIKQEEVEVAQEVEVQEEKLEAGVAMEDAPRTVTVSLEDLEKLIEKRTNEKLQEIIPQAKKAKEQELETKIQEVDNLKQQLETEKEVNQIDTIINNNVDERFKDYVKWQVENGQDINTFLNDNPQYKVAKPVIANDIAVKETTFLDSMKDYAKNKGYIKK